MNFAERTKAKLNETLVQESLQVAAIDILPVMRKRIFDDGLNKLGSPISQYSTRPLRIAKKDMSQTGGGVDAGAGFKFFAGGYKEYKQSLGRGENFDLRNFGVMMRDFLSPQQTLSGNSIKYDFKQKRNKDIAYEPRYADVWGLSESEQSVFTKTFNFELAKRLFQ